MNSFKGALALLLAFAASPLLSGGAAHAAGNNLTAAQIQATLGGNYACGTAGSETWDETIPNAPSGTVTDYKQGSTDPIDPTKAVGTFTINNNGGTINGLGNNVDTITYNYGGPTLTYIVQGTGTGPGSYTFVGKGAAPTLAITVSATPCQPHRT